MDAEELRREHDGDVRLITCLQHRAAVCEEIAIVTDQQEAKKGFPMLPGKQKKGIERLATSLWHLR